MSPSACHQVQQQGGAECQASQVSQSLSMLRPCAGQSLSLSTEGHSHHERWPGAQSVSSAAASYSSLLSKRGARSEWLGQVVSTRHSWLLQGWLYSILTLVQDMIRQGAHLVSLAAAPSASPLSEWRNLVCSELSPQSPAPGTAGCSGWWKYDFHVKVCLTNAQKQEKGLTVSLVCSCLLFVAAV